MLTLTRKHRHSVNHLARESTMKVLPDFRPSLLTAALAAAFAGSALAQTTPPAPAAEPAKTEAAAAAAEPAKPEPDWTFTSNVGLFSQYVFRGVSQTNEKPAVQGGFDLGHKSGFYVGTWASNISWIGDSYIPPPGQPGVSSSLEWDFYGGYKGSLPADFGYDLGVLYYYYPGKFPSGWTSDNTTELYAALTWQFLSLKYSYSANNQTFGVPDSRGSGYIDLTASYDVIDKVNDVIGKVTLMGHVGRQVFRGNGNLSYTDWKVGASTEVYGVTVGIFGTGTNAQDAPYTNIYGKNLAGNQFVGYIQKTF
jgi:uncharacterized protein (TIGR02001 family)